MNRLPASVFVLSLAIAACFGPARAASSDYRFLPIAATVERGGAVTLRVELRESSQNRLVPGAEISNARVDRSPDGRPDESHSAFFEPSLEYGVYRFRADLPTDGNWALTFLAKISGEAQPILAIVTIVVTEPIGPNGPKTPAGTAPR